MYTPDIKSETEAGAVACIVWKANTPVINVEPQGLAIFPDGKIKSLQIEDLLDHPLRKRAQVTLHETHSFIEYVNAHKDGDTTHIFGKATEAGGEFRAIVDFHARNSDGQANRGEHVCSLSLATTPEWRRWLEMNNKQMTQEVFAEFLEDNLTDIIRPDAAALIDIAQLLTGKKAVTFKSGRNLKNGAITLEYSETIESSGGRANGDMQVPDRFVLGLCPFVGGDGVEMEARLRYRISDSGKLTFSYVLTRPFKVIEAAFNAARLQIEADTGYIVLLGSAIVIHPTS